MNRRSFLKKVGLLAGFALVPFRFIAGSDKRALQPVPYQAYYKPATYGASITISRKELETDLFGHVNGDIERSYERSCLCGLGEWCEACRP